MDYLVFGTGMGATLVLVGLAGRTLGPALRYRTPSGSADVLRAEQLVARFAWARFCSSLGASLALAGAFLLVVTGVLVIIHVDDGVGTTAILVAVAAVILLMTFWSWAYVRRFGLIGITAPRAYPDVEEGASESFGDEPSAAATTPASSTLSNDTATMSPAPASPPTRTEQLPAPKSPSMLAPAPTTTTATPRRTTQPPSLTRRDPAIVTVAERPAPTTTPLPPMVTHADPARSEIVNPSDAAALDRILAEADTEESHSPLLDDIEPATDDPDSEPARADEPAPTTERPPNG